MKKHLIILLAVLTFLVISFQSVNVAYAKSINAEIWLLESKSQRTQPAQVIPWGLNRIKAPDAWSISTGIGVQIAVLDTGVDKDHLDLSVNIKWGISVVGNKNSTEYRDWKDRNGHGTHVIGTIAAINNNIGVVGVAYNVEIYAIKVLDNAGFGTWKDAAEGIDWAMKGPDGIKGTPDDADVISMSFGGFSYDEGFHNAIKAAYNAGIVLVAAAGNEGDDGVTYPAKFPEVIAVAAIDENDNVPSWSSKGQEVELSAPGVNILSTLPGNKYDSLSGTSMATPHVSGTVGLMIAKIKAEGRTYTVEDIRNILRSTADDIGAPGWDSASGYGVVRADLAVSSA